MSRFDRLISRCEPRFVKKISKMVDLCTRDNKQNDAVLIIEGREGTGKTNGSMVCAAIFKHFSNRASYMYFDLEKLIGIAQSTVGKIFIWDEPALDSLTSDQMNELNKNLMKLLMTCRVNRHFFIFNITDFTKFSKYITIERPVGFIHLQKLRTGHGLYIRFKRLEALHQDWTDHRRRRYNKYRSFFMDFPLLAEDEWQELDLTINGIPHASLEEYTTQKRQAISQIGKKDNGKNKIKVELRKLKKLIATEPRGLESLIQRAKHYHVDERQLRRWAQLDLEADFDEENGEGSVLKGTADTNMFKKGEGEGGGEV